MTTLIKHYFQTIDLTSTILIPFMLFIFYAMHIPPMYLFFITVVSIPIIIYYLNHKHKVDRYLVSFPVRKKDIIKSRYLFTISMSAFVLLFQIITMFICTKLLNGTQYVYSFKDIVVLLCLTLIICAIVIPIYHIFRSFIMATTVVSILFFLSVIFTIPLLVEILGMEDMIIFNDLDPGLSMLIEEIIPYQPFLILMMISIIIFYISMTISRKLYIKRDIH